MTDTKKMTGFTLAMVKVGDGKDEVPVKQGEEIPANLAKGEMERLESLGAFDEPRKPGLPANTALHVLDPDQMLTRVSGVETPTAALAHGTAPPGEEVTTPGSFTAEEPEKPAEHDRPQRRTPAK